MYQVTTVIQRPSLNVEWPFNLSEMKDGLKMLREQIISAPGFVSDNPTFSEDGLIYTNTAIWESREAQISFWNELGAQSPEYQNLQAYYDANGFFISRTES